MTGTAVRCVHRKCFPYRGAEPLLHGNLILGMRRFLLVAGGLTTGFWTTIHKLTADDLADYFRCHGIWPTVGDTAGEVDGITAAGAVTLRASNGVYPSEGVLTTAAVDCNLRHGACICTSEYISGITAVSLVETSTSDDLEDGASGRQSLRRETGVPHRAYIRFRVTLTTTDTSRTPKVIDIRLYDIPKAPYEKIGYARPVVLDSNGAWEAVLENAYDIIVTSEINGEDTLSFKIPLPMASGAISTVRRRSRSWMMCIRSGRSRTPGIRTAKRRDRGVRGGGVL